MIKIEKVKTKKQVRQFVQFPLDLYKNCPYYVPQFFGDELKAFNPKNNTTEKFYMEAFLAKDEKNKVVGRVAAVVHKQYNKIYNDKRVRFSRLDYIDNLEVLQKLMNAVNQFALENKMETIVGPMGVIDQDREGMLTDGFDRLSTYALNFNYSYYPTLMKAAGFDIEATWIEKNININNVDGERFQKMCKIVINRYNLHVYKGKSTSKLIKKFKYQIFDLVNDTYGHLYGYVPLSHKDIDGLVKQFQIALRKDYISLVMNDKDEVIGMGLAMPSIAQAVHDCDGKLNLIGICKVLKAINNPKVLELLLIAVKDEYKKIGVPFIIINEVLENARRKGIVTAESNAQLVDNDAINKLFDNLHAEIVRERVAFKKNVIK